MFKSLSLGCPTSRTGPHSRTLEVSQHPTPAKMYNELLEKPLCCLFVCCVALRPKSTAMGMAGRSVHLTTAFPGQAWTVLRTHTFACNWQQPFLKGRRITIDVISWSISTKVWDRALAPESAVRNASVARHVTDWATRPYVVSGPEINAAVNDMQLCQKCILVQNRDVYRDHRNGLLFKIRSSDSM